MVESFHFEQLLSKETLTMKSYKTLSNIGLYQREVISI